jgi:hypothetical protein
MREMYLDFNPIRRTTAAVDGFDLTKAEDLAKYHEIIDQTELDPQFTLDFFGGWSWKVPRKYGLGKNTFIVFNLGVNNLLNERTL